MSDSVFHSSLSLTTCKSTAPSDTFSYIYAIISWGVKTAFRHFETHYTLAVKFDQHLLEQMVSLVETHVHIEKSLMYGRCDAHWRRVAVRHVWESLPRPSEAFVLQQ